MSLWPNYLPHERFIAPARKKSALWRFAVGMLVAVAAYVALNQTFFSAVYGVYRARSDMPYVDLLNGETPLSMFVLLFSFVFMSAGVGISVRLLHGRSLLSVLGPLRLLRTDFVRVTIMMVLLLLALAILPPWDMGAPYVHNTALGLWLLMLPLSLLAVLVQVSAEEIVFRGYIQQQLAARFKSPIVWMILPSALFSLGHYLPQEAGENALMIAIWAGVFGVLMADLTARAGSLGPAIAVHLWNNVSAILIVGLPDNLGGLALFHAPFTMQDAAVMKEWLPVDFALMLTSWLAARLAIRR